MTAMCQERQIFENEEWLVTESGLEHKTTGYFIDRESLGQRRDDGLWAWPLHMAEKSWCTMTPFAEAFSCAASVYRIETGPDLAQTFRIAQREVSSWPSVAGRAEDKASNPPHPLSRTLHPEGADPIFVEPGSPEKSLKSQGLRSPGDSWRMRSQTDARPFSVNTRFRPLHIAMVRDAAFPRQAQRRIRKTGTKLVRLLQAAWNIR